MEGKVQTIRPTDSKSKGEGDDPFDKRSDRVTVIAPGVGTEVEAGNSVRETLAEAGIFPTPQQLVRLGREEVRNLERVVEAGGVLTVVNKVRAGR